MYTFSKPLARPTEPLDNYYSKNYYLWDNCADNELIQSIIELGESLEQEEAKIGSGGNNSKVHKNTRISSISWIRQNEKSQFFFDFLIDKIDRINYHHFGMNLTSMEGIQYTRYPIGGHYAYHNDINKKDKIMRKLSFVLSLTDPNDYAGGEFLIMPHGENPEKIKFKKGDLIAFPSWVPHKVQPVTEGLRITAVTWAYGPLFV